MDGYGIQDCQDHLHVDNDILPKVYGSVLPRSFFG
jgi:hypothetical protein